MLILIVGEMKNKLKIINVFVWLCLFSTLSLYQIKTNDMNPVNVTLVKALNSLIKDYNNQVEGINFVDVRDFEAYIESKGINIAEVNEFINK